jgi:hypothetical protein
MTRLAALLFVAVIFAQTVVTHDSASGLVIHSPAGWHVDVDSPAFAIESFPANQRPPQLLVPPGGARIMVAAPPVKSIEEFVQLDRLTVENGYTSQQTELKTSEGRVAAKEIRMDLNKVIPQGHTLIHAFSVRGRIYETYLLYRGANDKTKYEKVYYQIVSTLEFPR